MYANPIVNQTNLVGHVSAIHIHLIETMAQPIHRVTLFKIEDKESQQRLLDKYKQMPQKAVKNGKPYILSVTAGAAKPDQRAQGFTVAAISVFSSVQDMNYYDNECAAHAELKALAKTLHQGAMMVFFENVVS